MLIPGDLENNGYYPLGEFDTTYNQTMHGVVGTYYYDYKIVDNEIRFIVKNNKLVKSTQVSIVRAASEYITAKNIKNKFSDISGNIVIYQASHHGLNNSEEAMNTLNINRSDVYVVTSNSISHSDTGLVASLQLKDKMCLLNGECGGTIPAATVFDNY